MFCILDADEAVDFVQKIREKVSDVNILNLFLPIFLSYTEKKIKISEMIQKSTFLLYLNLIFLATHKNYNHI